VDSLNGWRADSVVLTASEFASLVGSGMDRELRSRLDSLQIELLEGEIQVSGRLHTDRRVGAAINHKSNAGTASYNPGVESLFLTFGRAF
jgi:hypothetical protein